MIVAGTGHRPPKLGGYSREVNDALVTFGILQLGRLDPSLVISGMALGWDQALAQAAIDMGIPFHAYVPFIGQESKWPMTSQQQYTGLISRAENVLVVSTGAYSVWKMHKRNERMVDASDTLLALWDGSTGGTGACVRYAIDKAASVVNVWAEWQAARLT